jgi:hypothetical protein
MKHLPVFAFLFLVVACQQPGHTPPTISFYYWRTTFSLDDTERVTLRKHHVSCLYLRYCDVALRGGQPAPVSPILFQEPPPDSITIVPVVYIKNEVMLQPGLDVATLAKKVLDYVDQISAGHNLETPELQIDCDWSLKSRDTYFRFLKQLKQQDRRQLSATIRLHQVKYYNTTGLPPVDRSVLMYYNMGRFSAGEASSVYDRATAAPYLTTVSAYPRNLDIALPIFSWGIHLHNNQVVGLVNKTDEATFAADPHFEQKTPPFFEVKENILKLGNYFKQGDRVKIESITADDLRTMADDLAGELPQPPKEIIFYDLDAFNLNHYQHEENILEDVRHTF